MKSKQLLNYLMCSVCWSIILLCTKWDCFLLYRTKTEVEIIIKYISISRYVVITVKQLCFAFCQIIFLISYKIIGYSGYNNQKVLMKLSPLHPNMANWTLCLQSCIARKEHPKISDDYLSLSNSICLGKKCLYGLYITSFWWNLNKCCYGCIHLTKDVHIIEES